MPTKEERPDPIQVCSHPQIYSQPGMTQWLDSRREEGSF